MDRNIDSVKGIHDFLNIIKIVVQLKAPIEAGFCDKWIEQLKNEIVTYEKDRIIFCQQSKTIENGIDRNNKLIKKYEKQKKDIINLIES